MQTDSQEMHLKLPSRVNGIGVGKVGRNKVGTVCGGLGYFGGSLLGG